MCESQSGKRRARLAEAAGARLRERVQQEHRLAPGRVDLVPLDGLLRGGAALSRAAPRAAAHRVQGAQAARHISRTGHRSAQGVVTGAYYDSGRMSQVPAVLQWRTFDTSCAPRLRRAAHAEAGDGPELAVVPDVERVVVHVGAPQPLQRGRGAVDLRARGDRQTFSKTSSSLGPTSKPTWVTSADRMQRAAWRYTREGRCGPEGRHSEPRACVGLDSTQSCTSRAEVAGRQGVRAGAAPAAAARRAPPRVRACAAAGR